ncbi:MAG: TetR/AcrR family transcriptional regulator, partial [Solirubrobacterales bacterium]|nr:TetR/AcrR family transcriptional regulator [Solirubrobacterales bacterium]
MATHIDETRARRVRRPRGEIAAIQRARIIAAALDAVEDIGYERMTVAQVISRARVSRKTFYDVFEDRDQCFLAALDQALAEASALAKQAYAREKCWQDGVRSALATLLDLMDEAPGLAKACVVETLRGGELVLARRARVLAELASVIDAGRASPGGRQPPALTPEAIVGGVL